MNPRSDARTAVEDPAMLGARDAQGEAQHVVGDAFIARVLEPSPPAVVDGDWFADDPVATDAPSEAPVVSPMARRLPPPAAPTGDAARDQAGTPPAGRVRAVTRSPRCERQDRVAVDAR